jgi:hypothetical protein
LEIVHGLNSFSKWAYNSKESRGEGEGRGRGKGRGRGGLENGGGRKGSEGKRKEVPLQPGPLSRGK